MRITRVRKRDGREAPFDKRKIEHAVARALQAVGDEDLAFASEVADVVDLSLGRRYLAERALGTLQGDPVPSIEEIQDLVEQALIELGHAPVAKAYILYRDRRSRIRSTLEVRRDELGADDAPQRAVRAPRVQVANGLETWRKGRIVAALVEEGDLPRPTAEEIASRVEERVFHSGLKRISTALIRELVDNELVEMGLAHALRRQRPVSVPRHDLRRWLAEPTSRAGDASHGGQRAARGVEDKVGASVLSRYALEDVLSERAAEGHLGGEFFVEDLDRPHLPLLQSAPCELLVRGELGPKAAFQILDEVARLASGVSRGFVLEDAGPLLTALARSSRERRSRAEPLSNFLLSAGAVARALDKSLDLVVAPIGAHSSAFVRALEELALLEDDEHGEHLPRVFAPAAEILALCGERDAARVLELELARGRLVPVFDEPDERFAAPGLRRGSRERGALVLGSVAAVNVARAARRAGPWREDALFEELARTIEAALDALAALREFQRSDKLSKSGVRGRTSHALSPVGLREALRIVSDGEPKPELAARTMAFIAEAAQRFGAARGLSVVVTPFFGERAAVRFAVLDARAFPVQQPLLFDRGQGSSERAPNTYSRGFELAPDEPGPASSNASLLSMHAAASASLRAGAHVPASALRALCASAPPAESPVSAALARLEQARERRRPSGPNLYVLPKAQKPPVEGELWARALEAPANGGIDRS